MKRFIISLGVILFFYSANSQSISRSIWGNMMVNTEGGNQLELDYYNSKGVDVVSICDWYYSLTKNGIHHSVLVNTISTFKSELQNLQMKYEQWIRISKANRVKEVEKEIPCEISYINCSCDAFSYPTSVVVKPYFIVNNYVPHCEIRIWQYFYNRPPNYNVWRLSNKDIPFLLSAIDKSYSQYLSKTKQKQETESLFR